MGKSKEQQSYNGSVGVNEKNLGKLLSFYDILNSPRKKLEDSTDENDQYAHMLLMNEGRLSSEDVVGSRTVPVIGITSRDKLKKAVRREPLRGLIHELHELGKHVAITSTVKEVTLFVAEHRKSLIASGIIGGVVAAAAGGGIYLTRRRQKNK